jgi:hypothetical protein
MIAQDQGDVNFFGIRIYPFGNRVHLAGYIQFVYFSFARPLWKKGMRHSILVKIYSKIPWFYFS